MNTLPKLIDDQYVHYLLANNADSYLDDYEYCAVPNLKQSEGLCNILR